MTDASRQLEGGLFLSAGELFSMEGIPRWDDIVAMARDAEALGFDSVWMLARPGSCCLLPEEGGYR